MHRSQRLRFALLVLSLGAALAVPASAATLAGGVYPFAVGDTFVFEVTRTVTTQSGGGSSTTTIGPGKETTVIEAPATFNGKKAYPYLTTGAWTGAGETVTVRDTEYRNFLLVGKALSNLSYGYIHTDTHQRSGTPVLRLNVDHTWGAIGAAVPFTYDILARPASWSEPVAMDETTDNYYATGAPNNVLQQHFVSAADGSLRNAGLLYDVPFTAELNANGTGSFSDGPPSCCRAAGQRRRSWVAPSFPNAPAAFIGSERPRC